MSQLNFKAIELLKTKLDSYRPLEPALANKLREVYRIEWTYHSNAIEGNTLSLLETKLVVEDGLTVGNGKTVKEHFEAINHADAIDYVEDIVLKNEVLTERTIKQIHYLVLKNIDNTNAGNYRKSNVKISGSEHTPPDFLFVSEEMANLMKWYEEVKQSLHPVELAAIFHHKFVYIHPFVDGNGRTARLLMNLILMQYGYPPAIVKSKPENKLAYYQTLEEASVNQRLDPFVELISKCVEESLTNYLHSLGIT